MTEEMQELRDRVAQLMSENERLQTANAAGPSVRASIDPAPHARDWCLFHEKRSVQHFEVA